MRGRMVDCVAGLLVVDGCGADGWWVVDGYAKKRGRETDGNISFSRYVIGDVFDVLAPLTLRQGI